MGAHIPTLPDARTGHRNRGTPQLLSTLLEAGLYPCVGDADRRGGVSPSVLVVLWPRLAQASARTGSAPRSAPFGSWFQKRYWWSASRLRVEHGGWRGDAAPPSTPSFARRWPTSEQPRETAPRTLSAERPCPRAAPAIVAARVTPAEHAAPREKAATANVARFGTGTEHIRDALAPLASPQGIDGPGGKVALREPRAHAP